MNWNVKQRASTIARMLGPYQSCYETLLKEQCLTEQAKAGKRKELQQKARSIREKFGVINAEGFAIPNFSLLRKAVISIRKGKLAFSRG